MKKNFESGCFYCGSDEHRRHECPKLSATLKAQGLRRVAGQWVPTDASFAGGSQNGSQNGEDWYCSLLGDSDGGSMEAVFGPLPPTPWQTAARQPRSQLSTKTRFVSPACACCPGANGAHSSRFAHATAWDALAETAADTPDAEEFPELGRVSGEAATTSLAHSRVS